MDSFIQLTHFFRWLFLCSLVECSVYHYFKWAKTQDNPTLTGTYSPTSTSHLYWQANATVTCWRYKKAQWNTGDRSQHGNDWMSSKLLLWLEQRREWKTGHSRIQENGTGRDPDNRELANIITCHALTNTEREYSKVVKVPNTWFPQTSQTIYEWRRESE